MAKKSKRIDIDIPPDVQYKLNRIQRKYFQEKTQQEVLCCLIRLGLRRATQRERGNKKDIF